MNPSGLIPTHPACLVTWVWLPQLVKVGRIFVGPLGETLIARGDGGMDQVLQGGAPWDRSISADPTVTRSPAPRPVRP